jgi:hypothetical protein
MTTEILPTMPFYNGIYQCAASLKKIASVRCYAPTEQKGTSFN